MRRRGLRDVIKAGRDDRHADLITEGIVNDNTEDDVRLGMDGLAHQLRGCEDLTQADIGAALEEHEHAVSAVDRGLEQRGGDSALNRSQRAILTGGRADAHESRASVLHDGLDIVEVNVDQTRGGDQLSDALNTGEQNLIRGTEGIEHRDTHVRDFQESIIGNNDEGIDLFAQRGHAALSLGRTAVTLEGERTSHNSHRQSAGFAGDACDDRSRTGTRATALTGGHEDHVRAVKRGSNLFDMVLCCLATDGRIRSGAEAVRQFAANVQLRLSIGHE